MVEGVRREWRRAPRSTSEAARPAALRERTRSVLEVRRLSPWRTGILANIERTYAMVS